MQIAEFICCDRSIALCQCKNRLGLLTGLQILLLIALAGLENDEGDVVGIQHGMRNGADFDLDTVAVRLDDGDMLLTGGVGNVVGSFFGAMILATIQKIIALSPLNASWWQEMANGALLGFFIVLQSVVLSTRNKAKLRVNTKPASKSG